MSGMSGQSATDYHTCPHMSAKTEKSPPFAREGSGAFSSTPGKKRQRSSTRPTRSNRGRKATGRNQVVVRFLTTITRARMSNAWRLSSRIMTIIPIGITTQHMASQWIIQKVSVAVSITSSNESNGSNLNVSATRDTSGSNIPEMNGSSRSPAPIDRIIHKMLIRTKRPHGAMSYNERTAACRRVTLPPVRKSRTRPPNTR